MRINNTTDKHPAVEVNSGIWYPPRSLFADERTPALLDVESAPGAER